MTAPRRWPRRLALLAVVALLALAGAGLWTHGRLAASLAILHGERTLPGLEAPVRVMRDGLGIPTIRGESRRDVARATGFAHAQDRFFQMDLARRRSAGELSELFGPAAVEVDRRVRLHRFRSRAGAALAAAGDDERALLGAYADGVGAGLAALGAAPPEYLILGLEPRPWQAEDTLLVTYSMFLDLHHEGGEPETLLLALRDTLPRDLAAFLSPRGDGWDAPLVGDASPLPPPPGPQVVDLRSRPPSAPERLAALDLDPVALGSNSWAVAGSRTADGGAILANDMHLALRVPNIWYRAAFVWPEASGPGGERRVSGVTLPGTPLLIAGSTGSIAWGFTNSQGDWLDVVLLEPDPADETRYLTPEGSRPYTTHHETIGVRDGDDVTAEVRETIWGPVAGPDHRGRLYALRWTAHAPEGANVVLGELERAVDLDDALEIAARAGAPPQNLLCADASGRIGWTILGRIPRRFGHDGRLPASWADGSRGWDGWLQPDEYPRVVDPEDGLLWTANSRVVEGEDLDKVGDGSYAPGGRARQIRDALRALDDPIGYDDMRAIQLDDRALFLGRWQRLLLEVTGSGAAAELRPFVEDWGGRAAVGSVGYRAARAFRSATARRALLPLLTPCREQAGDHCDYLRWFRHYEGPLWQLVSQRPPHLLDAAYASWEELLAAAAEDVLAHLRDAGAELADRTWGERNTMRIRHPLSQAVPALSRFLDMPREPLPGDSHMPRVQHPANGASERFAVSPGREEMGYLHMPTGQSGHFLSPFYASGHRAWADGEPTPFLSGETRHVLVLAPR